MTSSTGQTLEGNTLKILTLTDEFTRQSLALRVAESFTSMDVKDVLHEVIAQRGAPGFIRSDNGPEFIARDLGSGWPFRTSAPGLFSLENPGRTGSPRVFTLGCGRSA